MKKQCGFTLIEVLVSVVILGLGLLGLANLQTRGLAENQSAYFRSQATQLAYDIADKMRANSTSAANYKTAFMSPSDAKCTKGGNPCTSCAINTPCTSAQMAVSDLYDWNNDLKILPNGTGAITENGGIYTVTVSWDDAKTGAANLTSFQMSFRL